MTIRLHYAPGACSFVPHVGLELAGEAFEPVLVRLHKGEHQTPEYLAMNPDGQVPVLQVAGRTLTQIIAICDWIAARHPGLGLLPADPWARAQTLSLLAWINNTVHPTFAQVFLTRKFVDDPEAQKLLRASATERYRAQLERIQGWVSCAQPFLNGERPSFLDAYVLTVQRWGGYAGIDPATMPVLRDYVVRFAQHPEVAAVIARERIELNTYKPD
ncbi:MAG: glutathione S-transferase family protein [Burkholderiales bacterium]|jgi:glutathione S-transferase